MNICPAYAGMILSDLRSPREARYLSRVCGDDPALEEKWREEDLFVPRMRG